MKNKRNYYRILHVQPDAPLELIRMSYRTIMQKLKKHPDLGGDEWDAAVINEAYSILSDDKLRAAYDQRLLRERTMADAGAQSETQRGAKKADAKASDKTEEKAENKADDRAEGKTNSNTNANTEEKESAQTHSSADESSHTQTNSANDDSAVHGDRCLFCGLGYEGTATEGRDCVACASPLMRSDPQIMESNKQRSIRRQPNYCPLDIVAFWPGDLHAGVLADLSPNGMKFRFNQALKVGHVLKVHCALFTAVAKVAHCEETDAAFLLGAEFLSIRFSAQQGTFVSTSA